MQDVAADSEEEDSNIIESKESEEDKPVAVVEESAPELEEERQRQREEEEASREGGGGCGSTSTPGQKQPFSNEDKTGSKATKRMVIFAKFCRLEKHSPNFQRPTLSQVLDETVTNLSWKLSSDALDVRFYLF